MCIITVCLKSVLYSGKSMKLSHYFIDVDVFFSLKLLHMIVLSCSAYDIAGHDL